MFPQSLSTNVFRSFSGICIDKQHLKFNTMAEKILLILLFINYLFTNFIGNMFLNSKLVNNRIFVNFCYIFRPDYEIIVKKMSSGEILLQNTLT